MAVFQYQARNAATGRLVRGSVEAESVDDLMEQLRQTGYVPLRVTTAVRNTWLSKLGPGQGPLKAKELAVFYRQLSTMVRAGLPVVTALEVLAGQEQGRIREVAAAINLRILRGSSLAEAMSESGNAFPAVQVELIRSGEMAGHLDAVLERLAAVEEKELNLRSKVKSASIYPCVVVLVACGVLTFMLTVVLPTFMGIFEEFDAELPIMTQILLGVVNGIRRWWAIVLVAIAALVFLFRRWANTPEGRKTVDHWKLRLPVFGQLQTKMLLASMARNLSMLLGSGLTLMPVLMATTQVMGNAVYRRALEEVRSGITQGASLADSMRWTGVIPDFVVEMVQVGEQTGELEQVLGKVAEYYDQQAEEMVANLSSLLEPFLLLFVGVLVALVLVSLFTPIVGLLNVVDTAF